MPPKGPVLPSSVANVGNSIKFHEYFAVDLSAEQPSFMAQSQVPTIAGDLGRRGIRFRAFVQMASQATLSVIGPARLT
jgi:hypothetical protein